jgi:hypothetical protein
MPGMTCVMGGDLLTINGGAQALLVRAGQRV